MLDHPDKTTKLLAALKAAVPFEVELTEWLVKQLRAQHHAGADQKHHTVSDLSYAGDQGGIVCHIVPPEKQEVLVVSLTQLHVPRAMPLAAAIADSVSSYDPPERREPAHVGGNHHSKVLP